MQNITKDVLRDVYDKVYKNSDMDWAEIVERHSLDIAPDTLRKAGVGIKWAADAGVLTFDKPEDSEYDKHYKDRILFYDQRREYNKLLRDDARWDYILGEMVKAAEKVSEIRPLERYDAGLSFERFDKEAVLLLSDWHWGMMTNNVYNSYNPEIARTRIEKLRDEVIRRMRENGCYMLTVILLGDLINGQIHTTSRILAAENVVDQVMNVAEIAAELINDLSSHVNRTRVFATYGNHGRAFPDKKQSIHGDNLELIIPWWLFERFADREDVSIEFNNVHELVGVWVRENTLICGVHGDLESKGTALELALLCERNFDKMPDYIVSGHLHTPTGSENLGIVSIQNGSLCGTDEFAKNHRLFARPSQSMLIFTKDGLDSIHPILV